MALEQDLKQLLLGKWEKIVVQGGILNRRSRREAYVLFDIGIYVSQRWVEISAVEIEEGAYEVTINVIEKPPIPDSPKYNNPPMQLLKACPSDCQLDKLSFHGAISLEVSGLYKRGKELLCSSLVIRAGDGSFFEILPSYEFPESIELREISVKSVSTLIQ